MKLKDLDFELDPTDVAVLRAKNGTVFVVCEQNENGGVCDCCPGKNDVDSAEVVSVFDAVTRESLYDANND